MTDRQLLIFVSGMQDAVGQLGAVTSHVIRTILSNLASLPNRQQTVTTAAELASAWQAFLAAAGSADAGKIDSTMIAQKCTHLLLV